MSAAFDWWRQASINGRPGCDVRRFALVLMAGAGLVAGTGRAAIAPATYDLGTSGSGTFFAGDAFTTWLTKGSLPAGSILRSVSIDATLDSTNNDNWAWDLMVMVDPTPEIPGGDCLLAVGNGDTMGPNVNLTWAGGYGGAGTKVTDTKNAPANFPATIDLHNAAVMIGNSWDGAGVGGTWSGTVTITYDTPDLACITTFGLPGNPAVISGTNIVLTVPNGTNVTALAPTYTLTSGTCTKASGSIQNFSTPQTYSVTDGTVTKAFTVTVVVQPAVTLGLSGSPLAEAGGVAMVTATLSAAWQQDVMVNLAFAGTATMPDAYSRSGATIVIPAGRTSGFITLTAVPDTLYQNPNRTIVVNIVTVVNATLRTPQSVTAVIADDDPEARFPLAAGQRGSVACRDNPAVSYDIYLPGSYSTGNAPLPILYTFSPVGGGMVSDFQNVCSSLQIICIGVINSRNGDSWDAIYREIHAVTRDVRQRVLFDPTAEMGSGFSGGGWVSYEFSRFRGSHAAGAFPMGGWMGVRYYSDYTAQDRVPSGLLVARAAGTSDAGANSYLLTDKSFLTGCGAVVQDWSFPGGHEVAPDEVKTAALTWILNNRAKAGAGERAAAQAQANEWRTRIGAGDRQTVMREAVAVLMNQRRSWHAYQAQLILDLLMGDASFRTLDLADLAQGNFAREHFYCAARGAALNGDWQTYHAAMKALAGITGANGYRSDDIYALLGSYGYPAPVLRVSHADGQLELSLSKDTLGLTYMLQSNPDLTSGNWQDVVCTAIESNTAWSTTLTVPPGSRRGFFRVRTTPSASAVP